MADLADEVREVLQLLQAYFASGEEPNILVAGKAGVGKSSLINSIYGDKLAEEGRSPKSVTHEIVSYTRVIPTPDQTYENKQSKVTFWDSPGFGDIFTNKDEELKSVLNKVHLLVYCFDIGKRMTKDDADGIVKITELVGHDIWVNTVFSLNFSNEVGTKEEDENPIETFNKLYNLWYQQITKVLHEVAGVPVEIVNNISIVASGYRRKQPPGIKGWYTNLWMAIFEKIKREGKPQFCKLTVDRFVDNSPDLSELEPSSPTPANPCAHPVNLFPSGLSVPLANSKEHPPEQQPGEGHPPEQQPGEGHPPEQQQGEAHSPEQQPDEAHPPEQQPGEAHPPKQQPGEAQPPEQQPDEAHPLEQQPGEAHPPEQQPSEAHPPKQQPGKACPPQQPSEGHPSEAHAHERQPQSRETHPRVRQPPRSGGACQSLPQSGEAHPRTRQPPQSGGARHHAPQSGETHPHARQPPRSGGAAQLPLQSGAHPQPPLSGGASPGKGTLGIVVRVAVIPCSAGIGAVVGALIGHFGGPVGLVCGATVGAKIGAGVGASIGAIGLLVYELRHFNKQKNE
jgi:GTPase SAR1 family protein